MILLKIWLKSNGLYLIPFAIIVAGVSRLRLGSFVYFNDGHDELLVGGGDGNRNWFLKLVANIIVVVVVVMLFFSSSTYPKLRSRFVRPNSVTIAQYASDGDFGLAADAGTLSDVDVFVIRNLGVSSETGAGDALTYYADNMQFYPDVRELVLKREFFGILSRYPILSSEILSNEGFYLVRLALSGNEYLSALIELSPEHSEDVEVAEILDSCKKRAEDRVGFVDADFSYYVQIDGSGERTPTVDGVASFEL